TSATTTPPPTPATTTDPASVVRAYVAAINARDYQSAWALGGKNLIGGSYASFVAGFADTASDTLTVLGTRGQTVDIDLVATHTDGTVTTYTGSYTVAGGELVSAHVHQT
ncbi:MAG TPA: hypothetical protein VE152_13175, partial [Acidimicrobiales bacterium]|nr:hypothetical protein [Acidimicrobiales bacterium]